MDAELQHFELNDKDMVQAHEHEEAQIEQANVPLEQVDVKRERRVLWKQDLLIIPVLWLIFFVAYLDRGAIGNARLMGLQEDLHLSNLQYFQCLEMFFVGYFVVVFPIAIAMKALPAQYVFGVAIIVFGLCASLVSVCGGYAGLMVLRTFLGCGEGVLVMGFLYLSQWYKPDELSLRTAFMYWSTPVASFSSGLISYGVSKHLAGDHGLQAWKWLFIIEGVPSVALGCVVLFILPSLPDRVAEKGHFLFPSREERQILLARYAAAQNTPNEKIRKHQIWVALKDPKTYLSSLNVIGATWGITAFSLLLPTFINEMGFNRLTSNLYTIIPYSFAVVSMPVVCWLADKYRVRALPHAVCLCTSLTGFIILLSTTNVTALMAGACFVACGTFPDLVVATSWLNSTHGGYTKRAFAFAVSQVFVQGLGIMVTQIYKTPPRYFLGHGILLGVHIVSLISCGLLYVILTKENRSRDEDAEKRRTGELPPNRDIGTFEDLCDFHPDYRYAV